MKNLLKPSPLCGIFLALLLLSPGVTCVFSQEAAPVDSTQSGGHQEFLHPDSAKVHVDPKAMEEQPAQAALEYELEEDEKTLDHAIESNEKLIKDFPNDPFVASAMFQLSELYVRKARHIYRKEMADYEKNYRLFEAGQQPFEPILPTIRLGKAIDLCYDILDRFPRFEFKDQIYYRLAICHLDEGNYEKSRKYFHQLIYEYPQSEYLPEAHFRIGEYYFSKRDFKQAIKHYENLLESWDCPYFNMALYKLGWSYYNIEDYTNAIITLVYLLGDIRLLEQSQARVLGKTNSDLRQEAIDYVAICFTEYGGAPEAHRFLIDKKKGNEDYNLLVFLKMGDIYQKRNFYQEAIKTYAAILEIWPFYQYAPVIQQKIVEAYDKDMMTEKAMEARVQLVERYGPGSKWLNQYPEGQIRNDAIKQAEIALYDYAVYYQAEAQEKKRRREYLIAVDKYRDYLKKFPRSDKSFQVNFYLAECLYEVEEYEDAAEEYTKVLTLYGPNEHQEAASYNRILAYFNILENAAPSKDTLTFYLEDFLGDQNSRPEPIKVGHKFQKDLLQSCNDFIVGFPKSENIEDIYFKFGESLYNLKQYGLAAKVYERFIGDFKESEYYASAFEYLMQAHFQAGNFDEVTRVGSAIANLFPDSTRMVDKARKLVASSGFKQAEILSTKDEPRKAANSFAKVAQTTDDPAIAKQAILKASEQFESLNDSRQAARVLEDLATRRPDLEFIPTILYKAATIHEEAGQWNFAIIDYMKIVDNYPNFKLAAKAHYNCGVCYENMEKMTLAESLYKQFLRKTYAEFDANDVLSAQYKIGEMLQDKGESDAAIKAYNLTLGKYIQFRKELRPVDEYIPAKAQYLIAEIANDRFRNTKIRPPLDKTVAAKRNLFKITLKNYLNAAKFNIAEWTTAAFYKIGKMHEDFGIELMSLAGKDLTEEQLQAQRAQVLNPMLQEALKYYKSNVIKAEKADISNEWVEMSRKRMRELVVELRLGSTGEVKKNLEQTANKMN